jgi:hypothetical protein
VRVLGVLLRLEDVRLGRDPLLAVRLDDVVARRVHRVGRQARRVGAHVCDETDRTAVLAEVDALVEALGDLHRALGSEAQAVDRVLLELARGVGGGGVSLALALGDLGDREASLLEIAARLARFVAVLDGQLLAVARHEAADEGLGRLLLAGAGSGAERRAAVPVLLGDERLDLALTIDDEPQRDALHAPGAQAEGELAPDEGRHVVSDDAVEDPPAPLGVVQILVELARVGNPVFDALLRDLVELDALRLLLGRPELVGDVPGDGFTLAVGVGRQQDLVDVSRRLLEIGDDLLLAWNDLVRLLKSLLDVDAQLLRQVFDVAFRCNDVEPGPQVLLDRLGLRGRLDDDERLSHQQLLFRNILRYSAIVTISSAEEARRALY